AGAPGARRRVLRVWRVVLRALPRHLRRDGARQGRPDRAGRGGRGGRHGRRPPDEHRRLPAAAGQQGEGAAPGGGAGADMSDPGRVRRASAMLVVVTLLWGTSFPWTKTWQQDAAGTPGWELLSALTLIGLRMPLALVILALWRPALLSRARWRE